MTTISMYDFEKKLYGMTHEQAIGEKICVHCKSDIFLWPNDNEFGKENPSEINSNIKNIPGIIYSEAGLEEYFISGLCDACFNEMTYGEDDEDEYVHDLPFYINLEPKEEEGD